MSRRAPSVPSEWDPNVSAAKRVQYMRIDRSPDASSNRKLPTCRSSPLPNSRDVTMRRVHGAMARAPSTTHDPHRSNSSHINNTPSRRMWLYEQSHADDTPRSGGAEAYVHHRGERHYDGASVPRNGGDHGVGHRGGFDGQNFHQQYPHHYAEDGQSQVGRSGGAQGQARRESSGEAPQGMSIPRGAFEHDDHVKYYPERDQAALQRWAVEYARHAVGFQTARLEQELLTARHRIAALENETSLTLGNDAQRPPHRGRIASASHFYDAVTMGHCEATVILRTKMARSTHVTEFVRLPCSVTIAAAHRRLALDFSTTPAHRTHRAHPSSRRHFAHRRTFDGSDEGSEEDVHSDDHLSSDIDDFFSSGITSLSGADDSEQRHEQNRLWNIDLQDVGEVRWADGKPLIEVRFVPLAVAEDVAPHHDRVHRHHAETQYRLLYISCNSSTDHTKELHAALRNACEHVHEQKNSYLTRRASLSPPRHTSAPLHPTPHHKGVRVPTSNSTRYAHDTHEVAAPRAPAHHIQASTPPLIPKQHSDVHDRPAAAESLPARGKATSLPMPTAASAIEEESALLAAVDALTRQHDEEQLHNVSDKDPNACRLFGAPVRHASDATEPKRAGAHHNILNSTRGSAAVPPLVEVPTPAAVPHRSSAEIALVNKTYNEIFGDPNDTSAESKDLSGPQFPPHDSRTPPSSFQRLRSESRQPLSVEDAAFILGIEHSTSGEPASPMVTSPRPLHMRPLHDGSNRHSVESAISVSPGTPPASTRDHASFLSPDGSPSNGTPSYPAKPPPQGAPAPRDSPVKTAPPPPPLAKTAPPPPPLAKTAPPPQGAPPPPPPAKTAPPPQGAPPPPPPPAKTAPPPPPLAKTAPPPPPPAKTAPPPQGAPPPPPPPGKTPS